MCSIIQTNRPFFLAGNANDIKFKKYMFIRKDGFAVQLLGDVSRHHLPVELICISDEDDEYWIGNYAEGLGLFGVKFLKTDCRDATEEEINNWLTDKNSIVF